MISEILEKRPYLASAVFDVEIKTPAGTLVALKATDIETAFTACKSVQDSSKDEELLKELNSCMRSFGFSGCSGGGYAVHISAKLPREKTNEKQTCGRRMVDFGPWQRDPELDTWDVIGGDKICSFCGSLHPDRVIELIKEHGFGIIERTDKSYKMYVRRNNVPNASFGGLKYYRFHDTDQFIDQWNQLVTAQREAKAA